MTRIDTDKYPNLAPLQALCDQQRAIAVMKRYGCYVVPRYEFSSKRIESTPHWIVRTRDGYDMPLSWSLERADRGVFDSPEAALIAAGEYLDAQGKEGR